MLKTAYIFVTGILMGISDSMPGISGSTITYLMGLYDKVIESIDNLVQKDLKKSLPSLIFLIKLGLGWGIGFFLSIMTLSKVGSNNPYLVSSLFLGFIIFSIPYTFKNEIKINNINKKNFCWAIFGLVLVILISAFGNSLVGNNASDTTQVISTNYSMYIYYFVAGAIAISAMLLPGISGSTILVIFGLYAQMILELKVTLTGDFQYLPFISIFILGIIIGFFGIAKFINKLLKNNRLSVFLFIEGMMIGSIYPIILIPQTVSPDNSILNFSTFNIIAFLVGIILLILIMKMKNFAKERELKDATNL